MTITCKFVEIDGSQIAYRQLDGKGPAIVFLPGYMSDMTGSKATALFDWCASEGRACLLLDYSGCGASSGDFADGSLSRWRDEVLGLIEARLSGPVLLIGSSMGGWLMLLAGLALADRLTGMVGIAAAPDFSSWGYDEAQKTALRTGDTVFEDNPYGPEPTPTYALFWQDAQDKCLLETQIQLTCPVRLIRGQDDNDVPADISLRLMASLQSADVQTMLVKGGDHRLSRASDIALLLRTVEGLV